MERLHKGGSEHEGEGGSVGQGQGCRTARLGGKDRVRRTCGDRGSMPWHLVSFSHTLPEVQPSRIVKPLTSTLDARSS